MNKLIKNSFSLVAPFYNEEKLIVKTYRELTIFLKNNLVRYELIFVDDGSNDKSEARLAKEIFGDKNVKLISYPKNRGRGYALREGFKTAKGEIVGYIDSDLEIPIKYLDLCLREISIDDCVVVSKHLSNSKVKASLLRRISSLLFNYWVRLTLGLRVRDTQAGLKVFKKSKLDMILPGVKSDGWLFDLELLYLFNKKGFSIKEIPIEITMRERKIRISFIIDFLKSFWFVWKLKKNAKKEF